MGQLGRVASRECGSVTWIDVIARSEATKQSIFFCHAANGLLRGACRRAALCADPLARSDGFGEHRLKIQAGTIPSRHSGSRVAAVRNP